MTESTRPEQPYAPGAICEECGHFAGRHGEGGCMGFGPDAPCKHGKDGKPCGGMLWLGVRWPRPWDPDGYEGAT